MSRHGRAVVPADARDAIPKQCRTRASGSCPRGSTPRSGVAAIGSGNCLPARPAMLRTIGDRERHHGPVEERSSPGTTSRPSPAAAGTAAAGPSRLPAQGAAFRPSAQAGSVRGGHVRRKRRPGQSGPAEAPTLRSDEAGDIPPDQVQTSCTVLHSTRGQLPGMGSARSRPSSMQRSCVAPAAPDGAGVLE